MSLSFTKMHGLGNDFMVIDAIHQTIHLTTSQIAALARRDTGVGFDQCLLVESSHQNNIDFFYRIFNADGQEVGQCGNGARCLARFIEHYGLSTKRTLKVATTTTQMELHINDDDTVTVNMGHPKFNPVDIPLTAKNQESIYVLPMGNDDECGVHAVSVGNPHAVIVVPNVNTAAISSLGPRVSQHALFPLETNVGFMELISSSKIRLRVYERGCGETQACGSGAAAAVAIGRTFHQLSEQVTVSLLGGDLTVDWAGTNNPLFLTGPASFVYEGTLL